MTNFLKNLVYFLILVAVLVIGVLFAVQNTATVPLDLLVISLSEQSIALWVLLAFAVGGVLGMLTSIGLVLRLRAQLLGAKRKLSKLGVALAPEQPDMAAETLPEATAAGDLPGDPPDSSAKKEA
ncbi:MAG: LapA family protein [Halieaceae bacterium]